MSETRTIDPDVQRVWEILKTVRDPEIVTISVVELGIIVDVAVEGGCARVKMTPTFAACPAINLMRDMIKREVAEQGGFVSVEVETVFDPPWTTDRISPAGRAKLKAFGLAPPVRLNGRDVSPADLTGVACPYCESTNTALESAFGPTLCRAIHYCDDCRQSFEHIKPVA